MDRKPWPIIILAVLQLFTPLANILFEVRHLSFYPIRTMHLWFAADHWVNLISLVFLAPLSAFAIYCVKRWSYPIFLGCIAWNLLAFYDWSQQNPNILSNYQLFGSYLLNLVAVSYFLLKEVRMTYYNPRMHWWESMPRYLLDAPAKLKTSHTELDDCILVNLSMGGALISTDKDLSSGNSIALSFPCFGKIFKFSGTVVYQLNKSKQRHHRYQYGIQFFIPWNKKQEIRSLVRAFEILGISRRPKRVHWALSLAYWIRELVMDGRGILPEMPAPTRVPNATP
jgi:hypothetical protein